MTDAGEKLDQRLQQFWQSHNRKAAWVEMMAGFARAELERAAEIAEEMGGVGGTSDRLCEQIAAAIRKLKE